MELTLVPMTDRPESHAHCWYVVDGNSRMGEIHFLNSRRWSVSRLISLGRRPEYKFTHDTLSEAFDEVKKFYGHTPKPYEGWSLEDIVEHDRKSTS